MPISRSQACKLYMLEDAVMLTMINFYFKYYSTYVEQ